MKPSIEAMTWWDGSFSVHAYRRTARRFDWNWHYHPEIELTLITRGAGTRLVGDLREAYAPGDLVLLGPNLPHTWFSAESGRTDRSHEAVVVQFLPSAFPTQLLALPEFRATSNLLAGAGRGIAFPKAVARKFRDRMRALTHTKGTPLWIELAALLHELASTGGRTLSNPISPLRRSFKMGSRLERIVRHIEARCDQALSLGAVARFAGMTPSSFARYFRKMTGRTFVEFRNDCRIRQTCKALIETDRGILQISLEAGFLNLANFNRQFRSTLGMTPREYRKLHQPPSPVASG